MAMEKDPFEEAEWSIFGLAIRDARVLKARGQVRAGFRVLLTGLRRAQDAATGGEAWAESLLTAYKQETDAYRATRHQQDGSLK
jgi:hypothetical protein